MSQTLYIETDCIEGTSLTVAGPPGEGLAPELLGIHTGSDSIDQAVEIRERVMALLTERYGFMPMERSEG